MHYKSILTGVTIHPCNAVPIVSDPLYRDDTRQVNSHEYALQAEGVGSFYACDGNRVEYSVADDADPDWCGFFLTGKSKNGFEPEYIYKFGI